MSDNFKKDIEKAIKQKNESALEEVFEKIYYRYQNLVYYISFKIVKRKEEAEDITQEVFMRFFNSLKKTQFRNIKYWLVTAARNLSLNYLKSKDAGTIRSDSDFLFIPAAESKLPPIIKSLYRVLTDEEIDIIIMRLVFNLTFREIAAEKGATVDSVKGKYRRAIKKYKKTLD